MYGQLLVILRAVKCIRIYKTEVYNKYMVSFVEVSVNAFLESNLRKDAQDGFDINKYESLILAQNERWRQA